MSVPSFVVLCCFTDHPSPTNGYALRTVWLWLTATLVQIPTRAIAR